MPSADARHGRSARRIGLLGIACLAIAAWLAWPRPRGVSDELPALRCVLIDASAPVRRRDPGYAGHLSRLVAREAAAAREAGEDLAVALFDRGARFWLPPSEPDELLERLARGDAPLGSAESSAASDLAAGLELARDALFETGRATGSLLVVGDGTARGLDPEPLLAELAVRGVELRFEALPEPSLPDARIHELRLPRDSEPGAPLAAELLWSLDSGAEGASRWSSTATLQLACDLRTAAGNESFELELEWPADAALQRTQIALGPAREGAVLLNARLELRGPGALRSGDPLPENDFASATGRVGSTRVALALAPSNELGALRAWLSEATPGIDWIVRAPSDASALSAEFDLVCSFDVTWDELPHAMIEASLARGGGWFHAGGWSWLAKARGSEARRVQSWSPLEAADPGGPPVERLFLVDGSGSMRGDPFEAVRRALEGMLPLVVDRDRIVLQLFSNSLGSRVILAEAGAPAGDESLALLRAVQVPGGATEILDCLDVIARREVDAPVERATVLLLTDGREDDALRVAERAQQIRDSFRATRRELSALAAGTNADLDFLAELVGSEGRLVRAEAFDELSEVFREAVGSERTIDGEEARAMPARPQAPEIARELAAAFDAPVEFARAVRAVARPAAGVLWATADGTPLLALSRVAGGTTAALATRPGVDWGGALRAVDLAPLWRALARGNRRDVGITARIEGEQLLLQGCGPELPPSFEVEFRRAAGPHGTLGSSEETLLARLEFAMPFAASGRDQTDMRRADFAGELIAAAQSGGFVLRSNDPPLAIPISGAGGAAYLPEARSPYRAPHAVAIEGEDRREGRGPHPAAPWVLGSGLLMIFGSALFALIARPDEAG